MGKTKKKNISKDMDSTILSNHHFSKDEKGHIQHLKDIQNEILHKIKKHIPRKKYYLNQSSFKTGTFRITKPGIYILKENIVFGPNPENDFRPLKGDKEYSNRAYSLGFFAAITIEVDGVELDLNNKTLKQDDRMAWMQRFYANIETASTPFIPKQGPGDFGSKIVSPKYIYIHNGKLGRSSHHGIHGNGNKYLVIENVDMIDYEFVGSAINGGHYVVYKDCRILHSFRDLKVLASWSAALFAQQFADRIIEEVNSGKSISKELFRELSHNRLRLQRVIDNTKKELFEGKDVSNPLFRNELKVGDGNMYGILSHPLGVAINEFSSAETMEGEKSTYFFIDNCLIKDIEGDVDEIITFQDKEGKAQKGPSGDLLKLKDCSDQSGKYRPNSLSELILSLARLKNAGYKFDYGTLNINNDILNWSRGRGDLSSLLSKGYKFITGQDSMAHHGKGVLGIRIDGTKHVVITHNHIENIINHGRMGAEYNKKDGGKIYDGCNSSAIHISYSDDVWLDKTRIKNIKSYNGESCGIKAIHSVSGNVNHCIISRITCGDKYKDGEWSGRNHLEQSSVYKTIHPNKTPSSNGIAWSRNCNFKCQDLEIFDLSGPQKYYMTIF